MGVGEAEGVASAAAGAVKVGAPPSLAAVLAGETPIARLMLAPDGVTDGAVAEWCAEQRVMVLNRQLFERDPDEAARFALVILGHALLGEPSCWHTSSGCCVRAEDGRDRIARAELAAARFLEAWAA
jgi:hypothetical protein